MPDSPYQSIHPLDVTTNGIQKFLETLNNNISTGPDLIPAIILTSCAPFLAPFLQVIFTQSYNTGTHPNDWIWANITPIFKTGDRTDSTYYRPISLTSIAWKIFEHIMNHLDTYDILTDSQHGFRPKRSCETQLITTHHDIVRYSDRRDFKQVDAILHDFASLWQGPSQKTYV